MLPFKQFTGGAFETNGYLIEAPEGNILIDAPQGISEEFQGIPIHLLVLTHGHFDHTVDAAKVKKNHGCRLGCHPDTVPMIENGDFFQQFGFQLEIDPVKADFLIHETESLDLLGLSFQILHVPGHCPGSICLFEKSTHTFFGGDVIFRGSVGRWDLPGGDKELLLEGIRKKILPLPPDTVILSGHGPSTTVAEEAENNPWLTA